MCCAHIKYKRSDGGLKLYREALTSILKNGRFNINWRDVQKKNAVNKVDMSSLKAAWQNGPYTN